MMAMPRKRPTTPGIRSRLRPTWANPCRVPCENHGYNTMGFWPTQVWIYYDIIDHKKTTSRWNCLLLMAWAANCWCQSIIRNRLNLVPPPHWYEKNWAGSHTSGHPHRTCLHRDHRAIGSHKTPGGFVDIQSINDGASANPWHPRHVGPAEKKTCWSSWNLSYQNTVPVSRFNVSCGASGESTASTWNSQLHPLTRWCVKCGSWGEW